MAQLVLSVTRGKQSLVGERPNDEELTAFYEGNLDATRRAQIMGYIAHDRETYRRWMSVVELQSFMKPADSAQSSPITTNATAVAEFSLGEKIKRWLFGDNLKWVGASFATFAAGIVVLSLVFSNKEMDYASYVDSIYRDDGLNLSNQWANFSSKGNEIPLFSPTRSFFSVKTDARKAIEMGYGSGAAKLDRSLFAVMGIKIESLTNDYPQTSSSFQPDQYRSLYELGRLSAFMLLRCSASPQHPQIAASYNYENQLLGSLKSVEDPDIREILQTFAAQTDPAVSVCSTATQVSQLVAK